MSQSVTLSAVPHSAHGYMAAQLQRSSARPVIHICANDRELDEAARFIASFAPELTCLCLPAWDCLPYDRVSPAPSVVAERLASLAQLASGAHERLVCLTTVSAVMQKLPPQAVMAEASFHLSSGQRVSHEKLVHFLAEHGYGRVSKVIEPGEFAVRGNIIDLFPAGYEQAIRLDLFGDDIESIKFFDPLTQISTGPADSVTLHPMNEILLSEERIERFRSGYRERFGSVTRSDPLYEAISAGRRYIGMEHWLPLFYEECDSLLDYVPEAILSYDESIEAIYHDRLEMLLDYYQARQNAPKNADSPPYHPLEPEALYLLEEAWREQVLSKDAQRLNRQRIANADEMHGVRPCPSYAAKSGETASAPFERIKERLNTPLSVSPLRGEKASTASQRGVGNKPVIIAAYSPGSSDRIAQMLETAGIASHKAQQLSALLTSQKSSKVSVGLTILPIEQGFETHGFLLISEQDLLGERIIRTEKRKRQSDAFLADASSLSAGELVVHQEHGIGRFDDLVTLEVNGARYDCLKLVYADDAKLFLPVVNMELISRFGSDGEGVQLDKLGAASWQKRKAAMKQRIKLAAEELLKIAARRATRQAAELEAEPGSYSEFCARFPYSETDDQQRAIAEVLSDIASGKPMDRLVCGDVGFGKTEVALRAAFIAACGANKVQVAVIAPTTLLARQHYQNFRERFKGFSVTVKHLSRLVSSKEQRATKDGLKEGSVDIVIGTHALLSKQIEFANLGMVIVDEEQRFGVAQKERLKQLRANIHVLTLTATPIPRTLQMALAGVRELSLITTPPVDRLAIRSFVMPYDGLVIKEAIEREFHRGGKVFYVTPRIEFLDELESKLKTMLPDVRIAVAHGQMPASTLEDTMQAFYDGQYDLLLSTAIVESGLDVPSANTIIIDHAEMFGLAALYQLRGRVGRGKIRAYAYLTLPARKKLTDTAQKRLEVMSQLDSLGAGFTLASHDMDIRGFGNLLGEEQSGHVREVGVELYQHMLEETIAQLKAGGEADAIEADRDDWSPSINLSSSVLIPESYVDALDVRMQLYRRLASLTSDAEIESFAAELIDRFGSMPEEVRQLIKVLHLKRLCKQSGIERIDTGPNGAVFTFRGNAFVKPDTLLRHIMQQPKQYKIRADQKLVFLGKWSNPQQQFEQINSAVEGIAGLVA